MSIGHFLRLDDVVRKAEKKDCTPNQKSLTTKAECATFAHAIAKSSLAMP